MRSESRRELGNSVTDDDFNRSLPPWEDLPTEAQEAKMSIALNELLKPLDRAGYVVRKKGN